MHRHVLWTVTLLFLTACGGGGGGGSGNASSGGGTGVLKVTSANAYNVAAIGFAFTESAVQLGLAATNPFIDLLDSELLQSTVVCGSGGSTSVTVTDNDSSGMISAGDAVEVRWNNDCFSGELNDTATGTFQLDVSDYFFGSFGELFFIADVNVNDFRVGGANGVLLSGSFRLELVFRNSEIELVRIGVAGAQSISVSLDGGLTFERSTNLTLRREMTRQPGSSDRPYTLSANLAVNSDILEGIYSCRTTRTLASLNANRYPTFGEFQCSGAGGTDVLVNSDRVSRDSPLLVQVDTSGNGVYVDVFDEFGSSIFWNDFIEGGLFTERVRVPSVGMLPRAPIVTPQIAALAINDMVYAPDLDRIYATTDTSVVELSPDTLAILRSLDVNGRPGAIGISDDESTAWIALDDLSQLQNIDLAAMTPGGSFALGDSFIPVFGPRDVYRIRIAPGTTGLVVISTASATEMIAYNNGVQLIETINDSDTRFSTPSAFVFKNATDMVAADIGTTALSVFRVRLDPVNGLSVVADIPGLGGQSYNRLKLGSKYTFASSGAVFDENSESVITSLNPSVYWYNDLDIDTATGVIIAMSGTASQRTVDIFDENTFSMIGQYRLPVTTPSTRFEGAILTPSSLVFKQGDELKRLDRNDLAANLDPDSCERLDLSGLLVDGTYVSLDCGFTTAVYDSARDLIYAGVNDRRVDGNSVAVIDVATFDVLSYIPTVGEPTALAIASDGDRLFVTLRRASKYVEIDLTSQTVAREVPIGYGTTSPYIANTIATTSSPDGDVVISMNTDVALYGNGSRVGIVANQNTKYDNLFVSPDGATAFGRTNNFVDELSISSSGIVEVQAISADNFLKLEDSRGNIVFSTDGRFFDMTTGIVSDACLGTEILPLPSVRVGADDNSDLVYYAWITNSFPNYDHMYVVVCDASTFSTSAASETYMFTLSGGDTVNVIPLGELKIAILTDKGFLLLDRPSTN